MSYADYHASSGAAAWALHAADRLDPSQWPVAWTEVSTKDYSRCRLLDLPAADKLPDMSLEEALSQRRSAREAHRANPLTVREVSALLTHAVGATTQDGQQQRRYPSAGARFPIDIYLTTQTVDGLEDATYCYAPLRHGLYLLPHASLHNRRSAVYSWDWILATPVLLTLVADMARVESKYGERGYRFALLEGGHLMQNLGLVATALEVACASIGGFADAPLHRALALTDRELPLYCAALA